MTSNNYNHTIFLTTPLRNTEKTSCTSSVWYTLVSKLNVSLITGCPS